ncbi:MAG: glutamine synthetase family protein [Thaumarchaeota archaeon]|nr:glutamine synthetase family protein [Nitrososphaerota archaeon]
MSQDRIKEVVRSAKESGVTLVKFQLVETSLVTRAMASHIDALEENVKNGIGVSRSITIMNAFSGLVPGSLYGPESSEFRLVPDLDTYAVLPFQRGSARFIAEMHNLDMTPYEGDARVFLKTVLTQLDALGYEAEVAFESEFFVLRRESGSYVPNVLAYGNEGFVGDEGYDNANEYLQELLQSLSAMNVGVARVKKESGPGQLEVILRHTKPVKAADDFVTLRDAAKGVAVKMGLIATFLPKPLQNEGPSGLHIHLSLKEKKSGKNVFFDPKDRRKAGFSKMGYSFIGGILDHIRGMMPIACPLPNSYKRLVPSDVWVPVNITYGYDNRSVSVRIPSRVNDPRGTSSRIEFRVSDPTANPYLLLGLVVLAGLDGVKRNLDPGEPFNENAYKLTAEDRVKRGIATLPSDLGEAIAGMEKDPFVRKSLGAALCDQYLAARKSEWDAYCRVISSWEIDAFIASL